MRIRSAATAAPPFSSVRKPSTRGVGQSDRLAKVRFLTRPLSRKLSRNRMAGGELRLGTASIYIALRLSHENTKRKLNLLCYMATTRPKEGRGRRRNSWLLYPQKQKLRSSGRSCRGRRRPAASPARRRGRRARWSGRTHSAGS